VIGDRTPFDESAIRHRQPSKAGADGRYVFTKKDGTPHERCLLSGDAALTNTNGYFNTVSI